MQDGGPGNQADRGDALPNRAARRPLAGITLYVLTMGIAKGI